MFSSVTPVALISRSLMAARLPTESSSVTEPKPPSIVRFPGTPPASTALTVPVIRSSLAARPPVVIVIVPPSAIATLSSITTLPPVDVTSSFRNVRFAATVPGPVPISVMSPVTDTVSM